MIEPDLGSLSVEYVEAPYAQYLDEPAGLAPEWREYFRRVSEGNGRTVGGGRGPTFRCRAYSTRRLGAGWGRRGADCRPRAYRNRWTC